MKNAGLKFIILIAFIALLFGIVYVNWDAIKKLFNKNINAGNDTVNNGGNTNTTPGTSTTPKPSTSNTGGLDMNRVLKLNVYNSAEVSMLQQLMNQYQPTNKIIVDGDFGPNTQQKLLSISGGKLSQITLAQAYQYIQNGFQ